MISHPKIPVILGVIVIALAGCLGAIGDQPTTNVPPANATSMVAAGAVETPPESAHTYSGRFPHDMEPDEIVRRISIGNQSTLPAGANVHVYTIINAHDRDRSLTITFWRAAEVQFHQQIRFPPHGGLELHVYRGGTQTVMVTILEGIRYVIDAPDQFDCNTHGIDIAVLPDNTIRTQTWQTLAKCLTVTPTEADDSSM